MLVPHGCADHGPIPRELARVVADKQRPALVRDILHPGGIYPPIDRMQKSQKGHERLVEFPVQTPSVGFILPREPTFHDVGLKLRCIS